jgi:hypothetical protein
MVVISVHHDPTKRGIRSEVGYNRGSWNMAYTHQFLDDSPTVKFFLLELYNIDSVHIKSIREY